MLPSASFEFIITEDIEAAPDSVLSAFVLMGTHLGNTRYTSAGFTPLCNTTSSVSGTVKCSGG